MSKPFDPTKPVQTRDGRPARIICTDRNHIDGPIVALITAQTRGHEGEELIQSFYENGYYRPYPFSPHSIDLVNIPERTEKFLKVYSGETFGRMHKSLEAAKACEKIREPDGYLKLIYEDDVLVSVELVR